MLQEIFSVQLKLRNLNKKFMCNSLLFKKFAPENLTDKSPEISIEMGIIFLFILA